MKSSPAIHPDSVMEAIIWEETTLRLASISRPKYSKVLEVWQLRGTAAAWPRIRVEPSPAALALELSTIVLLALLNHQGSIYKPQLTATYKLHAARTVPCSALGG